MLYAIGGMIVRHTDQGTVPIQVPTFFLDSNVQGIMSTEHAERIARTMLIDIAGEFAGNDYYINAVEMRDARS